MFLECCVMCKLLQEMQDTNGTVKDVRLMHIYIKNQWIRQHSGMQKHFLRMVLYKPTYRPDRHIGYEVPTYNYSEQTNHAGGT